ncbi:MAG TPA: hypothetical protein VGQ83_39350 [Polyangia bacterium]|jgi:hypothetical protein
MSRNSVLLMTLFSTTWSRPRAMMPPYPVWRGHADGRRRGVVRRVHGVGATAGVGLGTRGVGNPAAPCQRQECGQDGQLTERR